MSAVRSICPYCGVGCGVVLDVRRGRIEALRGDPDHPSTRGGLCAKGSRLAGTVRTGDRLLHPLVRDRPAEPFRRAAWPAAVARVAGGIAGAVAEHGPGSVAMYLSGQLLTEDYYAANKLGKGLIKTANVDTNSRLCMSSTVAAYKRAFGADGPPGCYEDLDLAADVLIAGSNLAETHPVLFGRLRAARARRPAHWPVVDPRRTASAEAADEHLQIRPGTDVALFLGMAAAMFEEGLVDEARAGRACAGLDEYRAAAAAMPAARAAATCEVPEDRIRAAARRFARSPAALSLWCQGLNQSTAGTDKVSALIDLHLLTGQIGRPGAGPLSLTGQANAMGGREVGGLATELACHREWDDPEGRAQVERHWGLGRLPDGPGLTAVELVDAIERRQVRVLWVVCSNPLASLPDGAAVRSALTRLDLLVVQELYHPTDTGELAHVLLPAAGWAEKTGTLTNSERVVGLARRAVAPPGEARPDWEIFAGVGAALGAPDAFGWLDSSQVFDEHVRLTAGTDLDMTALSHAALEAGGPASWPCPAGGQPRARRYEDGRCHTPDGRPRLVAVTFREPAERPSRAYPLRLLTGREPDQWHTRSRSGRVAALRRSDAPRLALHPDDAWRAGVSPGETVLVTSPRGSLRVPLTTSPALRRGSAFLPFHAGPVEQPAGWPNVLPGRALDPVSRQPELKHTVVRVEPAAPEVALAGGPLADAVAARLDAAGVRARRVPPAELAGAGPGVLRVLVAEAGLDGAAPWWDLAAEAGGPVVLDLAAGPEPLALLPSLLAAGRPVACRGERWLPAPAGRLVATWLGPGGDRRGAAVVGGARRRPRPAPPGTLVLEPGGALGLERPLSGDPAVLASFVRGELPARAALRRVVVPLSPHRTLVLAGDPLGDEASDAEQGVDLLVHEDSGAGVAQVWRLAAGRTLGVAAVVAPAAAREVEAVWLSDADPDAVRSQFPVRAR